MFASDAKKLSDVTNVSISDEYKFVFQKIEEAAGYGRYFVALTEKDLWDRELSFECDYASMLVMLQAFGYHVSLVNSVMIVSWG